MLGNGGNIKDASIFLCLLLPLLSKIFGTSLPLAVENIYISKTFWLSGSIQLDVVREPQPTNLQLEKLTFWNLI